MAKFDEERFGVLVLRSPDAEPCEGCGKECLLLALGLIDGDGDWRPMMLMHESRLPIMLSVLAQVQEFLMTFEREDPAKEVA